MRPAGLLGHPEDVFGGVFVGVLGGGRVFGEEGGAAGFEGDGDVLEEDQAEGDVLVVGRLQVLAQLVGGEEELGLDAERGGVALGRLGGLVRWRGFIPSRASSGHGHSD